MAMNLTLLYQRQWRALDIMVTLNQKLLNEVNGQLAAPSERMIASMIFTRASNLLLALQTLLQSGLSLEGSALLRPLYENAADACYIAYHETLSPTALAERLINYQPIPALQIVVDQAKVTGDTDSVTLQEAKDTIERFYQTYPKPSNRYDWSGVGFHVKSGYLASALELLPTDSQKLLTKQVQPYLHQFVQGGPTVWQLLIDQNEQRINYKIGRQDHPVVMKFTVPIAVLLCAISTRAVVNLWQRHDLFGMVAEDFLAATAQLTPSDRADAA
jgi:hypothetical protein